MSSGKAGRVSVVGAGTMGSGIAQTFAQGGYDVALVDESPEFLDRCVARIRSNLDLFAEYNLLREEPGETLARISTHLAEGLGDATDGTQLVVESISENLHAKRALFTRLDALPQNVLLGSNTSSLTISAITKGMRTAERVVGTHYFNPAHIIPAVEIHRGERTSDKAVMSVREILERTGKKSIMVCKEVTGFVINRLTGALEREIDYLLDEGVVSPQDLDVAVKSSLGFRLACLGPMEAEDMIGLDIAARASRNIFKVLSNASESSPELAEKIKRGELGIKTGKGWYDYSGRDTEDVLAERNRRLLDQLALFSREHGLDEGTST